MAKNRGGRPPGRDSRHSAIAAEMRRALDRGEWAIGAKMPSYRALALKYKTGVETIRLAFNELKASGHVNIEPRRVARAAFTTSFQAIVKGTVVVVMSRVAPQNAHAEPTYGALWEGLVTQAGRYNLPLLVLQHEARWRTEFPAALAHAPIAGFVLFGVFSRQAVEQYRGHGTRTVLLDSPLEVDAVNLISVNNRRMMQETVARLTEFGHCRIAFVRTVRHSVQSLDPDSRERELEFRAACVKKKRECAVFTTYLDQAAVFQRILAAKPRYTAMVCTSATPLYQVPAIAAKMNIRIPEQLSLVAPRPLQHANADVSGHAIDFEKMGRMAVELLAAPPRTPVHLRVDAAWYQGNTLGSC